MPTVILLRHGRTTANAAGVLAGWTQGVHLDDQGQQQASDAGRRLAQLPAIVQVVSSPLQRCVQTAHLVIDALAHASRPVPSLEHDDRFGECRYGAWTGRQLAELAQEPLWRQVQDHPSSVTFPDGEMPGESILDMRGRVSAALADWDARICAAHGRDALWLAVSHGDIIKLALSDALSIPLDEFQRLHVDPASLSVVRYGTGRPMVLRLNDRGDDLSSLTQTSAAVGSDSVVGGGAG